MNHWWTLLQFAKMKEKEMLEEAQRIRLINQAKSNQTRTCRCLCNPFSSLKTNLFRWNLYVKRIFIDRKKIEKIQICQKQKYL